MNWNRDFLSFFGGQKIWTPSSGESLRSLWEPWVKHLGPVWVVGTSGSTQKPKWVVGSQEKSWDHWYQTCLVSPVQRGAKWGLLLPPQHMGGLAFQARCSIACGQLLTWNDRFDARAVWEWIKQEKIHYISVVPRQLEKWVELKLPAPESLRLVWVGAQKLPEFVFQQALELKWPVWEVFGSTETSGFFAYRRSPQEGFQNLEGWRISIDQGRLGVWGPGLALGYLEDSGFKPLGDSSRPYWWTQDVVQWVIPGKSWRWITRLLQDEFKLNGRWFSLSQVVAFWEDLLEASMEEIVWLPVQRDSRGQWPTAVVGRLELFETFRQHSHVWRHKGLSCPIWVIYWPYEKWPRLPSGKIHLQALKELLEREPQDAFEGFTILSH